MRQQKKLIYFVIYWLLFSGLISRYIWKHEIIAFIPDLIVFYMAIKYPLTRSTSSLKPLLGSAIPKVISIFFGFSLIGTILNLNSPITYLWGVRMLLRYLLLFLAIYHTFNLNDIDKFKKIIYKSFYICMFFTVVQISMGLTGDAVSGIFTDNGSILMLTLLMTLISSADFFQKCLSTYRFLFILGCFLAIAIWCEIKVLYFIIPLTIYGIYVAISKFSVNHIIVLAIGVLGLVPTLTAIMSLYYDNDYIEKVFDPNAIEKETSSSYGFADGGFNRNTCIKMTNNRIFQDTFLRYIGYGLGSANGSSIFKTWIFDRYQYTTYNYFTSSYILIEVGWIGFILLALAHILLLHRFYLFYKLSKDKNIKYWSGLGMLSVALTFILAWYNNTPYYNFYLFYAFWAICIVAIKNYRKKSSRQNL